jgi:signal transduction histidine kinase
MDRPLASTFSATRRWAKDRPLVVDALFASVVALLAVADLATTNAQLGGRDPDLLAYAIVVVGAAILLWRRRAPIAVLMVVATVLMGFWALDYGSFAAALGLGALYSVAVHSENRRDAWTAILLACAAMLAAAGLTILDTADGFAFFNAVSMVAYLAGAVAIGVVIRNRERIFVDTQRRAAAAEADRLGEAQRAVAAERSRIAREMHDVVAHGMSVIAVQAAAAREIAHTNPDKTAEVLAEIENVGRESLTEMRRMLGVLRNGNDRTASLSPQPSLADVAAAVAQSVASGVATDLAISGEERDLPPGIELAAYRIVQEALTNVRKHAGKSASVSVQISYEVDAVAIEIADDGRGAVSSLSHSGGGNGLIGMRERVEIYNGDISAGPRPGGGYCVRVVLPTTDTDSRPSVASAASRTQEPTS